jgi:hypothetical protein
MKVFLAAVLGFGALASAASAQGSGQPPSLTLYEFPGFQGRSVTLYADNFDLHDTGVVGRAKSAQVLGQWRVCTAPGLGNRCQTLSRNVADLTALGLAGQVVSAALDMGYSQESWAPDPYAYDVEDYSAPSALAPPYPGPAAYAPPPADYAPEPVPATPYPQPYAYPDYGSGPAFGPPTSFDPNPSRYGR